MKINEEVLINYIKDNNLEILNICINTYKFDIHYNDEAIFRCAYECGSIPIIKLLIDKFPNINYKIDDGYVLRKACADNNFELIEYIIDTFPDIINKKNMFGITSVMNKIIVKACQDDNYEIIKWILNKFSDFNECVKSIFFNSAVYGSLNIFQLLCDKFYTEFKSYVDEIFLISSCNGHLDILRWLIEIDGIDINYSTDNENAFRFACINGHFDTAYWLKSQFPSTNHHLTDNYCYEHTPNPKILEWLNNECPISPSTKSARKL